MNQATTFFNITSLHWDHPRIHTDPNYKNQKKKRGLRLDRWEPPQFRSPNSSSTLQLQKNESKNLHHHRRHRSIQEKKRDQNKSKTQRKPNQIYSERIGAKESNFSKG